MGFHVLAHFCFAPKLADVLYQHASKGGLATFTRNCPFYIQLARIGLWRDFARAVPRKDVSPSRLRKLIGLSTCYLFAIGNQLKNVGAALIAATVTEGLFSEKAWGVGSTSTY